MGEVTGVYLDSFIEAENVIYGNILKNSSCRDTIKQDMVLKINISSFFFSEGFYLEDERSNGGRVLSQGVGGLISGLRKIGWDDNIIYNSIIESRDSFLHKKKITYGYNEVLKRHQCIELYDSIKRGLEVYLKVGDKLF